MRHYIHSLALAAVLAHSFPTALLAEPTGTDGETKRSGGVSIAVQVWPNPAQVGQKAHLHVTGLKEGTPPVMVRVRHVNSVEFIMQQEVTPAATVKLLWSLENYSPGLYQVEVMAPEDTYKARFMVR